MKVPSIVSALADIFKSFNYKLYCIGDCVRDSLLGVVVTKWELVTTESYASVVKLLSGNNIRYHEPLLGNFVIDDGVSIRCICSLEVSLPNIITANSIAYDCIDDTFIDPYNGMCDIKNKVASYVDYSHTQFLGILEVLDLIYYAVLLDFNFDEKTARQIHESVGHFNPEIKFLITQKFRKILTCGKPVLNKFMEFSDVICALIPQMKKCVGFNQNNRYHTHTVYEHILYVVDYCQTDKFAIKLAALLHDIAKPDAYTEIGGRGHFFGHPVLSRDIAEVVLRDSFSFDDEAERDLILNLVLNHDMQLQETEKAVKKALNTFGESFMRDWLILKQADIDDHIYPDDRYVTTTKNYEIILNKVVDEMKKPSLKDLAISGTDVMNELDIRPNRQVGIILNSLLGLVVTGKVPNDRDSLLSATRKIYECGVSFYE